MATDETQLSFEQPRSVIGTWLGVVLLFCVFSLFVWAVMGMMPRGDSYEQKRATARVDKLKTTREEASGAISGYAWVDKAKGTVRVPIQRAMELTVAELAQKKPAPANPLPPEGDKPGLQTTAPVSPLPAATPAAAAPSVSPKVIETEGKDSEIHGQPAAAANPPNAPAGSQPGPMATPAGPPPSQTRQFQPNAGDKPLATPVQSPAGTPIPIPGKTP